MKLNLYCNKPVILPRDPQTPMEAATKQYVDVSIATHANNFNLHLTSTQNKLLDNLIVGYNEINQLLGITDNVQSLLDTKLNLLGGILTGPLYLSRDPVNTTEAATKNYVDIRDSLRVAKSGDTMSGPLTLSQDPQTNMHAATKQYVDVSIATHANNFNLHLTSTQNELLDNLDVSATEINRLKGISANINDLLDLKFDKAGGLITGNVNLLDGYGIFVSKTPQAATELVNKNYVDSLIQGLKWEDPVADINLVADDLSTPPDTPVEGDVYIVAQGATGAWQGLDGFAVFFDGSSWVKLQNRPVRSGDRFGVALTTLSATSGGLASLRGKLVTVTVSNGQYSYATDSIAPGSTTLVHEEASLHFGESYTLRDDNTWVNTNTGVNTRPGDGLYLTGKIINVGYDRGITLTNNKLEVKLSDNHSLKFDADKAVSVALADNSLSYDSDGIRLSDATNSLIADKASKTQSNTITGQFVFTNTSKLKAQFSAVENDDVINKGYVDLADNALQSQIDSIGATVSVLNTDPVTKTYVDEGLNTKVNKAGDSMSGYLTLSADPINPLHAATKRYIDTNLSNHATNFDLHLTAEENALIDTITVSAEEINQLSGIENNVQAQLNAKLNLTGGVLAGDLILASDPQVDLQAATKHYVDNGLITKINKAGDTMTGSLTLASDPTANLHAATKQYVDNGLSTKLNLSGGTLSGTLTLVSDPTANLHAATKQYVDNGLATKLNATDTAVAAQKLATARKINGVSFDGTSDIIINAVDATARIPMSYMGAPNGVATLDANGLVPSTQLPSYVDDVLSFSTLSAFPNPGETGKIYVAEDTNYVYRWTGSNYIQINTHVGVADVATKLATARKINGTNFDGTSDITTTSWGTARTITIGNTAKSVDGSANVSWTITDIIGYTPVNKAGDTMTGALTLASDPTAALQAATKQYVDNGLATKLSLSGGTLTGALNLASDPSSPYQATTKQYVDNGLSTKLDKTATAVAAQKLSTARKINGVDFDGTSDITINAVDATPRIPMSYMGVPNGVATLDSNNLIPQSQIPSIVYDILEYNTLANFPATGTSGKFYVDKSTNYVYRWNNSNYVKVNDKVSLADNATKLATARKINGTNFDGSVDITTSSWGNARTITIGNTGKSVDGSINVSWSVSEVIGYTPVNKAGDTMTGSLTLSADPTAALQAATKQYVDNGLATKLNLSGGTLTGALTLAADPTTNLQAATKQYVDSGLANKLNITSTASAAAKLSTARKINGTNFDGTSDITTANWGNARTLTIGNTGKTVDGSANVAWTVAEIVGYTPVNKAGDTMTGTLTLASDPTANLHAATKQYVDNGLATKLSTTGNAASATKLATARKINGTNFDGSADITTTSWGTGRNITIGSTTKSVDGSINVSWTVAEVVGYTPVNKAGDNMLGYLTLFADPTSNLHAATKQYVDNLAINILGNLTTAFNNLSTTFANYGK